MSVSTRYLRLAIFAILVGMIPAAIQADDNAPLTVRITSPLGRMGSSATVRFVAQIQGAPDATLEPIRFYVDGTLLKTDDDGPPYAVEWADENPFERRELRVAVEDSTGRTASDVVVLEPFEIVEIADVRSVLLEASVRDQRGRFVAGLTASSFIVEEDGVRQAIDVVNHETLPATFALLIDSSQSMHRRIDFVRDAARRLIDFLRPADRMVVAPFSLAVGALTGPTSDRKTVLEAIEHIDAKGGTAILDSLLRMAENLPPDEGRRVIVLVTDGYDENSVASIDEVLAAVKAAQVTVYVVGIRSEERGVGEVGRAGAWQ